MTYWVFTSQAAADATQQVCMDALPVDTIDGVEAPVQITEAWADVLPTIDGRWGFVACPIVTQSADAAAVTDEQWALLRPAVQAEADLSL